jgi:hypothetical protein
MTRKDEDRVVEGSAGSRQMCRLLGERPKCQTWKARKHGCEEVKGCVWRRQRKKKNGGQEAGNVSAEAGDFENDRSR